MTDAARSAAFGWDGVPMHTIGAQVELERERLTPTRHQLTYLSRLASRNGATFVPPTTRQEAAREIATLRLVPAQRRARRAARRAKLRRTA